MGAEGRGAAWTCALPTTLTTSGRHGIFKAVPILYKLHGFYDDPTLPVGSLGWCIGLGSRRDGVSLSGL